MSEADDTLLAAYLDGVSELAPDERRRVEDRLANNPSVRDEAASMRAVLGKLRELPREGREPDWTAMAHAISAEAGPMPRPWWRRWQWLLPVGALAMTAAVALIWLRPPAPTPIEARHIPIHEPDSEAPGAPPSANALWLDGAAFDLDDVEPGAFEELDGETLATGASERWGAGPEMERASERWGAGPAEVSEGSFPTTDPATDLDWIDGLDDRAIERAEHWLDRKKS